MLLSLVLFTLLFYQLFKALKAAPPICKETLYTEQPVRQRAKDHKIDSPAKRVIETNDLSFQQEEDAYALDCSPPTPKNISLEAKDPLQLILFHELLSRPKALRSEEF